MSEYNVYSFTSEDDKQLVESGLSSGELRQSLMDRINHNSKKKFTRNYLLYNLGMKQTDNFNLQNIENVLYTLEGATIAEKVWLYDNEMIKVEVIE